MKNWVLSFALAFVGAGAHAAFAQHDMPTGLTHEQHLTQLRKEALLKQRGAQAMGFDQERTTHHFLLRPDGGIINVEVNEASDDTNRLAIRAHMRRIAADFAAGRFGAPLETHGEEPPGTSVMRTMRPSIQYHAQETVGGARVSITSSDIIAIDAIHEFLAYQIREHRTGDPAPLH
jgi:hypothetical protein